jgi:MFS family permease
MDRLARLKRNPRLLFWARACLELKALNAIVALFYLQRGVRVDQVFYLSIGWSIGTLLFEIPTGYLADRFGRKRTMLLGAVITCFASLVSLTAHGFWQFALQIFILSFAFSCFSGTEEAILYDGLKEAGEEQGMSRYNGRLQSARHIMKIVFPALGAWIAKDLLEWQFQVVIGIDVFAQVIAFVLLLMLIEPKHTRDVLKEEEGIFQESIRTIRKHPFLLRAALNKILIFVMSFLLWRAYQIYLGSFQIDLRWFSVFYFFFHSFVFLSNWYTDRLERFFGPIRILWMTVLASLSGLVFALLFKHPAPIFIGSFVAILANSTREPVFSHAMNQRIQSRSRATTLSNLYVLKALLDIPLLLLSGYLALRDPRLVYGLCIVLCLVVLFFFPIRQKDLESATQKTSPAPL